MSLDDFDIEKQLAKELIKRRVKGPEQFKTSTGREVWYCHWELKLYLANYFYTRNLQGLKTFYKGLTGRHKHVNELIKQGDKTEEHKRDKRAIKKGLNDLLLTHKHEITSQRQWNQSIYKNSTGFLDKLTPARVIRDLEEFFATRNKYIIISMLENVNMLCDHLYNLTQLRREAQEYNETQVMIKDYKRGKLWT